MGIENFILVFKIMGFEFVGNLMEYVCDYDIMFKEYVCVDSIEKGNIKIIMFFFGE